MTALAIGLVLWLLVAPPLALFVCGCISFGAGEQVSQGGGKRHAQRTAAAPASDRR